MKPAGFRRRWSYLLLGSFHFALVAAGASILAIYFLVPAWLAPDASLRTGAMVVGALLAAPPLLAYFWVPRLVGSLAPQSIADIALAFLFGAFAACGFSALFNTLLEHGLVVLGESLGRSDAPDLALFLSAAIGAPIVEEFWKGLAVVFAFRLFRRGPDVLQDGVVLATFSGIGFATVENVVYYARAAIDEVIHAREGALAATFVIRGLLSPWGHPLYAALTGLGLALGRELRPGRWRTLAPLLGYTGAIVLHGFWNGVAMVTGDFSDALLLLATVFVSVFAALFGFLVFRQGYIVRRHLRPEVEAGLLTAEELALVASPLARLKATRAYGAGGRIFVAKAAELAFLRRKADRTLPGATSLADWNARCDELRRELGQLRAHMARPARPGVLAA